MSKGIPETFDEHEVDTARREYPREVSPGMTTATMAAVVSPLRHDSGTRSIVTADEISAHVRARLADAGGQAPAADARATPEPPVAVETQPIPPATRPPVAERAPPVLSAPSRPSAGAGPEGSPEANAQPNAQPPARRGVVALIVIAGVLLFASAVFALGVAVGRLALHR